MNVTLKNCMDETINSKIEGAPANELSNLIVQIYEKIPIENKNKINLIYNTILHNLYVFGYDYYTSEYLASIALTALDNYKKNKLR